MDVGDRVKIVGGPHEGSSGVIIRRYPYGHWYAYRVSPDDMAYDQVVDGFNYLFTEVEPLDPLPFEGAVPLGEYKGFETYFNPESKSFSAERKDVSINCGSSYEALCEQVDSVVGAKRKVKPGDMIMATVGGVARNVSLRYVYPDGAAAITADLLVGAEDWRPMSGYIK